jgi:hypothetical protein
MASTVFLFLSMCAFYLFSINLQNEQEKWINLILANQIKMSELVHQSVFLISEKNWSCKKCWDVDMVNRHIAENRFMTKCRNGYYNILPKIFSKNHLLVQSAEFLNLSNLEEKNIIFFSKFRIRIIISTVSSMTVIPSLSEVGLSQFKVCTCASGISCVHVIYLENFHFF